MHDLSGKCLKCKEIFDRFPGFSDELRTWFEAIQIDNQILHLSCAGRNFFDQEMLFHRGATKAHFKQSAHNWNAAIDVFFLIDGKYDLSDENFQKVIAPNLYKNLNWYGRPNCEFPEKPHIEIFNWSQLARSGILKLIE